MGQLRCLQSPHLLGPPDQRPSGLWATLPTTTLAQNLELDYN